MISIVAIITLTCAFSAAQTVDTGPAINKELILRLLKVIGSNKTLDTNDVAFLNKTAQRLGFDKNIITKLDDYVKQYENQTKVLSQVFSYDVGRSPAKVGAVEESPDYASSVVLASDILALTNAVANVKENACREQGFKFLNGLLLNKRWALKMFDASAKSPQGLLFGSSYHLGNFDECVAIDAREDGLPIKGQYCLATIEWKKQEKKEDRTSRGETLRWAVCVPSSCSADAIADFVEDVLATTVGNRTKVIVQDRDCYTNEPITFTKLDVAFLSIIMFFALILLLSTIYEAYTIYCCQKTRDSVLHELVLSFSVINNMKKILSTKQHSNNLGLDCIAGIKALAMTLIVSAHACLFIGSGPVMDADAWNRLVRSPLNGLMTNNMLLVDTFLMLSAFLFSRLLLIELDKRKGRLNIIPIFIFRYIRITPAYAIVLLFYMTWLPKIGEGPLWNERVQLEQKRCMESWWTNILYINNYINTKEMCMFQSWYLSVDTQLFFIAPIFIFGMWRWRRFGPIVMSLSILISMLIPAAYTFANHLDPTFLFYAKEFTDIIRNYYFNTTYIKTHMKMTNYFMGLLTGYILHRIQLENYQLSRPMKLFGWLTSIILGTVTVFSVSIFYQDWYQYNAIEAAAYQSLHKLAWSIATSWLIIACATGNGGFMNKFLSWKFLAPISKLTFCAYLVNGIIELYYIGTLRHPLHITFFNVVANGLSHMMLTFCLSLVLCIAFESPIHGMEKILLKAFVQPVLSENSRIKDSRDPSRNTSQTHLDT